MQKKKLEDHLAKHPSLISIAALVGLGKSTLAAIMERSLRIKGLYENPEENPLLRQFLADKSRYCFDLQLHFLKMRSQQRLIGKRGEYSYVKDRSLPEDILIFCQHFKNEGYLTDFQLSALKAEFHKAVHAMQYPDLLITLQGPAQLSWQRIQQRGREMEIKGGWSQREITELCELYKTYPRDVTRFGYHKGQVLTINVAKLDITNRIHSGYIFEEIYKAMTQK